MVIAHVLLVDDEHWEQKVKQVANENGGPVLQLFPQTLVEYLMQKEEYLAIQKYTVDLFVSDGRFAAASSHFKRPQKVGDQNLQLRHVFALFFNELKHDSVAFAHAERMWRLDVVFDDPFPASTIQPALAQTLHLFKI